MSIYSYSPMLTDQLPWLTAIIVFPLVPALATPVIPDRDDKPCQEQLMSDGGKKHCWV